MAKRNYKAEERRRNQLARARGFRSRAEERKFTRPIRRRRDLAALPESAQIERSRSLRAISAMRDNPLLSIEAAAAYEGTTPEAMFFHVRPALERSGGRWRPTKADRILRAMTVISDGKVVEVDVRGSRKASELSRYYLAVRRFVDTGSDDDLRKFQGKKVAGVAYETDLDVIEMMGARSALPSDSIYREVVR